MANMTADQLVKLLQAEEAGYLSKRPDLQSQIDEYRRNKVIPIPLSAGGDIRDINIDAISKPEPNKSMLGELAKQAGSLGYGVSEQFPVPYTGTAIKKLIGLTGLDASDPQYVQDRPMAKGLGEALPDVARSVAGYSVGAGAVPQLAKGTGWLLNLLKGAGRGGVGGLVSGQLGRRGSIEPKEIASDVGIGSLLGTAGAGVEEISKLAGPLFKSALKGGSKASESDKLAKATEAALKQKGFKITLKGLSKKAGKAVQPLVDDLNKILKPIAGKKVRPSHVLKQLQKLRDKYVVDGKPIEGTKRYIKVIDDLVSEYKTGMKGGAETIGQAQEAKKKIWQMTKEVLEDHKLTPVQKVAKQAQKAAGTGRKEAIEEMAAHLDKGRGGLVKGVNKQIGLQSSLRDVGALAGEKASKSVLPKVLATGLGAGGLTAGAADQEGTAGLLTIMALMSTPTGRIIAAQLLKKGGSLGKALPGLVSPSSQLIKE